MRKRKRTEKVRFHFRFLRRDRRKAIFVLIAGHSIRTLGLARWGLFFLQSAASTEIWRKTKRASS
jgi:hypothetical protein